METGFGINYRYHDVASRVGAGARVLHVHKSLHLGIHAHLGECGWADPSDVEGQTEHEAQDESPL